MAADFHESCELNTVLLRELVQEAQLDGFFALDARTMACMILDEITLAFSCKLMELGTPLLAYLIGMGAADLRVYSAILIDEGNQH